ncbi:uncharacterized protein PV09_08505 [Verruconis gallopava]|uniref:Glutamine amidotransferase domain-containing protein n=1 Tax=Verruconis gallopava TaxID=253628 RepID=A0A0D1YGB5_9PEZI|nr:uncharacterized protein PV09_08505 [Verruconis gallopava]KIV99836.1 hypothetical protein PV09_08505 [Verruconis gallopava]
MAVQKIVRIAMLNTDTPVPNVYSKRGTYGNIFHHLLLAAAQRIDSNIHIQSEDFDVVLGNYPKSLSDFDAILITGSASSSYDSSDWIRRLDEYIENVYNNHPNVRIFGSCFGHQIVCQSLLRQHGVYVEKDPNGWELGVKDIELNKRFLDRMLQQKAEDTKQCPIPKETSTTRSGNAKTDMRLQFVHADHVKIPMAGLPSDWILVGSTQHCAVQGLYQPGHVLTYQGHFEFDRFINTETLKVFGASWEPERLQAALHAIDADDDSELAADMALRFLAGLDITSVDAELHSGLLTPPEECN